MISDIYHEKGEIFVEKFSSASQGPIGQVLRLCYCFYYAKISFVRVDPTISRMRIQSRAYKYTRSDLDATSVKYTERWRFSDCQHDGLRTVMLWHQILLPLITFKIPKREIIILVGNHREIMSATFELGSEISSED